MKVKTLSLVFLFMAANAAAQVLFVDENLNTDSLTALVSSKNGTEHVEVLNLLSNALCTENPDSSLILANQAIDLSEKLGYPKGRADGFVNRGNFYFLRDSLEPTISNFLKAIRIYETLPPSRAFGELCMVYGLINLYAGSSDIRETHYMQAKSIFEKTGDTASLGVACYFLGRWKTFNGEWDSSRYYHNLSFSYLADGSNPFIVGWDYIGIENSYRMQFYETGDTNYLHLAISTLFDALKQPYIEGDTRALYYISLSQDYREFNTKKGIAASRHYLEEVSHMADTSNLASGYKDEILSRLASLCLLEGDYKGAIELCERSLEITEAELAADPMELHPTPMISLNKKMLHIVNKKRANKYLFKAWSALGDYKQAHEHYVLAKLAEEELTQEKNEKLIVMMEATSLAEKTQGQIDLLARDNKLKALAIKQSRTLNFGIAAIFIVLLLVGLLLWRQNKLKNESRNKILEQKYLHDLELKHLEAEKLKELDHLKSRFFANISHEFRTPLTLIMGPVDNVLSQTENNYYIKELGVAKKYAGKLQTLINNLLTISKLESGKLQLHASETDVVMLVRSYLQSFESLAGQKNITLKFTSVDKEIKAYIDQEKFEQVLNNLLSNAFKITDEGGSIKVAVGSSQSAVDSGPTEDWKLKTEDIGGQWVSIEISDTGRGIPPEHINHIFDRFYQVGLEDNSYYEGTGIGLALTKELVELHRGTIKVESEPGKGSTFFLTLPLGKDHLTPEEIEVNKPQAIAQQEYVPTLADNKEEMVFDEEMVTETNNNQPILLIVEDNADMRAYIREYFENDYRIIEAVEGMDGLEKSTEHIPDIIISDVMMPRMDGNEFCLKVKSDERTSHIPVILLTARASSEDKIEGLETGADDFISKPFDGKELKVRVKNLIEQRKKIRAHLERKIQKSTITHHIDFKDSGITSMDEQFLHKVFENLKKYHAEPQFNTKEFGVTIGLSLPQLNRKIRALTGQSTGEFIRTFRLARAAELIKKKNATIAEIAYDVGFSSPSYFSECFKLHYGKLPSEFNDSNEK